MTQTTTTKIQLEMLLRGQQPWIVLALGRREIFIDYGEGMAGSKLVVPATKTGTARNMNTVRKLAELAAELELLLESCDLGGALDAGLFEVAISHFLADGGESRECLSEVVERSEERGETEEERTEHGEHG